MSGRDDDLDERPGRDPGDLLDENGRVDIGKVKQITNAADPQRMDVTAVECAEMRDRLARRDTDARTVAAALGYGSTTVRDHATGNCSHDHDTPPVSYDRSAGWSADG